MSDKQETWNVALGMLSRREHARAELGQKLKARGFESADIESTLDALEERDYLNEERYAEMIVRSRFNRGQGPLRIRQELRLAGVSDAIASLAMEAFDGDWFSLAKEVREKRFGLSVDTDPKARAKQMRFLQGRGFSQDHIVAACDRSTAFD